MLLDRISAIKNSALNENSNNSRFKLNTAMYDLDFEPEQNKERLIFNKSFWKDRSKNEPNLSNVFNGQSALKRTEQNISQKDKILLYNAMGGNLTKEVQRSILKVKPEKTMGTLKVIGVNDPKNGKDNSLCYNNCNGLFKNGIKGHWNQIIFSKVLHNNGFTQNDYAIAIEIVDVYVMLEDFEQVIESMVFEKFGAREPILHKIIKIDQTFLLSLRKSEKAYNYFMELDNSQFDLLKAMAGLVVPSQIPKDGFPSISERESKYLTNLEKETTRRKIQSRLEKQRQLSQKWSETLKYNWDLMFYRSLALGREFYLMQKAGICLGLDEDDLYKSIGYGVIIQVEGLCGSLKVKRYTNLNGYLLGKTRAIHLLYKNPIITYVQDDNDKAFFPGQKVMFRLNQMHNETFIFPERLRPSSKKEFIKLCRQRNLQMIRVHKPILPKFEFNIDFGDHEKKEAFKKDEMSRFYFTTSVNKKLKIRSARRFILKRRMWRLL